MGTGVVVWAVLTCILTIIPIASTEETTASNSVDLCQPLVVAHRGASGYVPEHTLGAYALAITMGADYVEPDLVMTRDGHLIARHENQLDLTTNVAELTEFADRYRTKTVDGSQLSGWFSEDFTLAEIKTLRVRELIPLLRPGNTRMDEAFDVPTLQEIIDLVKGLEISEQRVIGIYAEIKHGTHFQQLDLAMERPLVDLLNENGYSSAQAPVIIQSFEISNLKSLKNLTDIRLIQLLSGNVARQPFDQVVLGTEITYGDMATADGLKDIATYAYAVGPEKRYIIPRDENNRLGAPTSFVEDAHAAGLIVHPYTFRSENYFLPSEYRSDEDDMAAIGNLRGELAAFLATGIDGLFIDQPDVFVSIRGLCSSPLPSSSEPKHIHQLLMAGTLLFMLLQNLCHRS